MAKKAQTDTEEQQVTDEGGMTWEEVGSTSTTEEEDTDQEQSEDEGGEPKAKKGKGRTRKVKEMPTAPKENCKRDHGPEKQKLTPKGVQYCSKCYQDDRREREARKKLEAQNAAEEQDSYKELEEAEQELVTAE